MKNIKLFILISLASNIYGGPPSHSTDVFPGIDLRAQNVQQKHSHIFHLQWQDEKSDRYSGQLGYHYKYRILDNVKIGAHSFWTRGERHDDDWVSDSSNIFDWQNTNKRTNLNLQLTSSFRFLVPFVKATRAELNLNYNFNTFNNHQQLIFGGSLLHLINPWWGISFKSEFYDPMNFSEVSIYKRWLYLSVFHQFHSGSRIAFKVSQLTQEWVTSAQGKVAGIEPFRFKETTYYIGPVFIYDF